MRIPDQTAGARDPITGQPPGSVIETKEFMRTSEFWTTIATIFGLMIAGLALDALDSPRVSLLVTIVAASYVVSRGVAKAGSAHPFWGRQMNLHPNRSDDRDEPWRTSQGTSDPSDVLERIEARLDRLERTTTGRVTL